MHKSHTTLHSTFMAPSILLAFAIGSGGTSCAAQQATQADPATATIVHAAAVMQDPSDNLTAELSSSPDAANDGQQNGTPAGKAAVLPDPHRLGPFDFSVNWRVRAEAWDWFQPEAGQNAYAFGHSLLKFAIGQREEAFEWLVEGAQDAILGLPTNAVQPGRPGQLGLGGTYFAANANTANNADAFLKQAYVGFKFAGAGKLRVGRFTFLDGAEAQPNDKMLATVISTRVAQRLIGDFGFSAVQRSLDGALLGLGNGNSKVTLLAARPTEGVYQISGMDELNVDVFYGAFTHSLAKKNNASSIRIFAIGYIDERTSAVKTDNRSLAARTSDPGQIRIGTYGADYVHLLRAGDAGQFDFVVWGALQNGNWGQLTQRAGSFVGEAGWQPQAKLKPWLSAGYSFGSGDSNPNDSTHGTFFQLLPTPRPYARFPFYNMMNNEDFYGTAVLRLPRSINLRSEIHALRVANSQDLWYGGGGAFQSNTFGYTGRATNGNRSLANVWDVSLDCPLAYGFSITTYYAHAWGKALIANIYPAGTNAQFGYVETNFRF